MALRTVVIGCGPIGNRHAELYKEDPLAELVGVCDIRRERADATAQRLGVPAFYDAQAMLDALQPDVCSVATSGVENGSDHYLPTIQALEAGCHVLCEKPICNTIPEAEEMVACARRNNRCFGIDFNHRFTPAARLAKQWVDEGLIGDQLFVNMSLWIKNPNESSPWFMVKSLNPHSVDIMRYYAGDITEVHCYGTRAPGRKIWSTIQVVMRFASGAVGHLCSSYDIERGHPMERCEVAGTKGRFVLEDMWREVTLYPAGDFVKRVYTNPVFGGYRDFRDTFRERIHCFLQQVAEGASPEEIDGSGADGLAAQKVLQAIVESIESGRPAAVAP